VGTLRESLETGTAALHLGWEMNAYQLPLTVFSKNHSFEWIQLFLINHKNIDREKQRYF
jgi:hypothetical protein